MRVPDGVAATRVAAKIHEDNRRISFYSKNLLAMIQKQFRLNKINKYDYESFVNHLTCLDLQTEESRKDLERFIEEEMQKQIKIDVVV